MPFPTALLAQEDYKSFGVDLGQATGPVDPRFLARVGLLRAQQGKLTEAAKARAEIRWYADAPTWSRVVANAMDADFSWDRQVPEYVRAYERLVS